MLVEGFRNHVATEESRTVWSACGRSVVQVDLDEEVGPVRGMYGSMDAEL